MRFTVSCAILIFGFVLFYYGDVDSAAESTLFLFYCLFFVISVFCSFIYCLHFVSFHSSFLAFRRSPSVLMSLM